MKKPRIVDAMEHIDEDLITDAVSYKPKRNRISGENTLKTILLLF